MYNNVRQVFHINAKVLLNKKKCIQPNAPLAFATRSSVSGSVQDPLQAGMSSYTGDDGCGAAADGAPTAPAPDILGAMCRFSRPGIGFGPTVGAQACCGCCVKRRCVSVSVSVCESVFE